MYKQTIGGMQGQGPAKGFEDEPYLPGKKSKKNGNYFSERTPESLLR